MESVISNKAEKKGKSMTNIKIELVELNAENWYECCNLQVSEE